MSREKEDVVKQMSEREKKRESEMKILWEERAYSIETVKEIHQQAQVNPDKFIADERLEKIKELECQNTNLNKTLDQIEKRLKITEHEYGKLKL